MRLRGPLATCLLALLFAGCHESEETIRLTRDGSGTIAQTFTLDVAARDRLLRTAAARLGPDRELPDLPFAHPFSPDWVRALAAPVPGCTVERCEARRAGGRVVVGIEARFDRLEDAAKAGVLFTLEARLERAGRDAWRLTLADVWADVARDPQGEIGGRPYRPFVEALRPALGGLSLDRRLVLPTAVRETNGRLDPDGHTVRWRVDYDRLLAGRDLRLTVVFEDAEGLALHPFRHRVDLDALLVRCLEAPPGAGGAGGRDGPEADEGGGR